MKTFVCFVVAAVFCLDTFSAGKKGAPRYGDYPTTNLFKGKPAAVDLKSDPQARKYRTQLRTQTKEGPNFAGHYRMVIWGCGTGCVEFAIVDCKTGKVHFGTEVGFVSYMGNEADDMGLNFKLTSRLLIFRGARAHDEDTYLEHFYVWDGKALKLLETRALKH